MTNKEAIGFLQSRVDLIDKCYPDVKDYREALVIAIKALEQLQEKPEYIDIWNVGAILRNVPEQPDICKIYGGVCGYPIEACSECPKHEGWRPSKEQTRWIPVSERLPEDKQQILISIAWDDKVYEVRQGDIDSINYFKHFKRITSIAWMPIPDPYRGEEAEA